MNAKAGILLIALFVLALAVVLYHADAIRALVGLSATSSLFPFWLMIGGFAIYLAPLVGLAVFES